MADGAHAHPSREMEKVPVRPRRLSLSMCLSAVGFAALAAGCELVAGIQDIVLTGAVTDGGGILPSDEAPYLQEPDASVMPGNGGDEGASEPDADATVPAEASGASPDADAQAADGATADTGTPDANGATDANGTAGPSDASSLVGLDGGTLVLELIDDMEHNDPSQGWLDGPSVNGTWFTFDDGSDGGVLAPPPGPSAAPIISVLEATHVTYDGIVSTRAAHVTANNAFTIYGDGMGFNVNIAAGGVPNTFDASAYRGFVFWARALGAGAAPGTRFNVMDVNTAPKGSGGICDGGVCNGYFGFDFGKNGVPALTSAWQKYIVYFADLARPSWAAPDAIVFTPTQMIGCQVQLAVGLAADLWVDDIYFIRK